MKKISAIFLGTRPKVERAHFCTDQSLNLDPDFITASLRREKVHMV